MIRQDQITQEALDYCRQYKSSKYTAENAALLAFSDGAQWADENPKSNDKITTRDIHKEMTEASNKYAQSVSDLAGEQSLLSIAFCEGVRWADKNPADEDPTASEARKRKHIGVHLEERYTLFINGEFVAMSNSLLDVQELYDTMMLEIDKGDKLTIIRRRNYNPF